jgi:class 3 adenylate cyclase/YHS domain-containing protein
VEAVTRDLDRVFVIADLAGYTALTEAMSAMEAAKVVTRYVELARQALRGGAEIVERAGDELLIVAADAESAVRTAAALREAIESEPLFPDVRTGIHGGRVLEQDGRYFGAALNLAARTAGQAGAGQILCTARIAGDVAGLPDVECRPLGARRFKNVPHPVDLFEVVTPRAPVPSEIDPVCRMQVRPETAPARLPLGDATYYFCSFECAKGFAARPDAYVDL